MIRLLLLLAALTGFATGEPVVLDPTAMADLGIETQPVEKTTFETTLFALGRLEAVPLKTGKVSSRIAGRVVEWHVSPGDPVEKGVVLGRIESRQPGNPPPVVPVTAPLSGRVTQSSVAVGQPVEPEAVLLEISDLSTLDAVARIPEHRLGELPENATARIQVTAFPGETFTGELLRLGTALDPQSGTLEAFFRLPNAEGRLKPGMRCEFVIVLNARDGVASVPKTALQGEGARRFLFVKEREHPGTFVKRAVEVGASNHERVEIRQGVAPGDEVVTRGAYSLAHAGAGAGGSLKEALDAAHGHEHAPDGSELSTDAHAGEEGHDHDGHEHHDHDKHHDHPDHDGHVDRSGWMYVSGALLLLLAASFGSHFLPTDFNRRKAP